MDADPVAGVNHDTILLSDGATRVADRIAGAGYPGQDGNSGPTSGDY